MDHYICSMCSWEYDPQRGYPELGIEAGTPFEDLPEDFQCPVCGACKEDFFAKKLETNGGSPRVES